MKFNPLTRPVLGRRSTASAIFPVAGTPFIASLERCHPALLPLLFMMFLTACQHPTSHYSDLGAPPSPPGGLTRVTISNRIDSAWLKAPMEPFKLGPGDKLELELLGEPTTKSTTVVGPDGKVYFSFLPGVDVWGLTLAQAKARIENELTNYVRQKPQLSIILRAVESQRIWILGRVQAPGVYTMAAPMTVLEAISMSGGTLSLANYRDQEAAGVSEELADLRRSFVLRQGKMIPLDFERLIKRGDLSQNVYLQPDDFIYFPAATAREVYVLGAVTQPRPVPYRAGLTVASAVAGAYGPLKGAYLHHVTLVRGSLQSPEIAVVDYKRVIRGEAKDIELEPHDIVYVPFSPYRFLEKYVELALNTFVASAAINAGSKAVTTQPIGGVGVFIPVGSGVQIIPPAVPPPIR
jgi:polysaccharide biosynthesis/export protein